MLTRTLSLIATLVLLGACGDSGHGKERSGSGGTAGGGVGGTQTNRGMGGSKAGTAGAGGSSQGSSGGGGGTRAAGGSAGGTNATGGTGGDTRVTSGVGGSQATGGETQSQGGAAGNTQTTAGVGGRTGGATQVTGGAAGSTQTAGGAGGSTRATGGTGGSSQATGGSSQATGGTGAGPSTSDPNVVAITVDSGPTGSVYVDGAFATVTLCVPGTSTCQSIDHLLIDTGSMGVRVLESAVKVNLPAETSASGKALAECTPFVSGTSWGPVRLADVKIGGETASNMRLQLIGELTHTMPSDCSGTPITDLETLGSNGILGVGIFMEDCGTACTRQTGNPGLYYECTSAPTGGCTVTTVPVANQVANPITAFSVDNNGSFLQLPSVPAAGAPSVDGFLVFGIGTRANNALGSAKVLSIDANGEATTKYPANGTQYKCFIDSGSNGLYFLNSNLSKIPLCTTGEWTGFYCPQTTMDFSAAILAKDGSAVPVSFSVANASKFSAKNFAFSNLGGPMTGYPTDPSLPGFDWGLPFYFGRMVFTAIETQSTPAGKGPYFAF